MNKELMKDQYSGCATTAYSGLNADLQQLVKAIYKGQGTVSVNGTPYQATAFFNHSFNVDPENQLTAGVSLGVYYQPARPNEDTIGGQPWCSGARRLVVRVKEESYPRKVRIYAFYTTNHKGDNQYNGYTRIVCTPADLA